jgi:hypothetical protein
VISFILPTGNILNEYKKYENLFSFYHDGLRGIIRDLILAHDKKVTIMEDIIEKIIWEYNNSPDASFRRATDSTNNRDEIMIEIIAELISFAVIEMMDAIFMGKQIDVIEKSHRWVENDLIIILSPSRHG